MDSWSWISIIWSPRRIVRFRGALPVRKSLTWPSLRLSSACMTLCSGRWVSSPVSTEGSRVILAPSRMLFSSSVPSRRCLSRYRRQIRSLGTRRRLDTSRLKNSMESVEATRSSNWPPVVGVTCTPTICRVRPQAHRLSSPRPLPPPLLLPPPPRSITMHYSYTSTD